MPFVDNSATGFSLIQRAAESRNRNDVAREELGIRQQRLGLDRQRFSLRGKELSESIEARKQRAVEGQLNRDNSLIQNTPVPFQMDKLANPETSNAEIFDFDTPTEIEKLNPFLIEGNLHSYGVGMDEIAKRQTTSEARQNILEMKGAMQKRRALLGQDAYTSPEFEAVRNGTAIQVPEGFNGGAAEQVDGIPEGKVPVTAERWAEIKESLDQDKRLAALSFKQQVVVADALIRKQQAESGVARNPRASLDEVTLDFANELSDLNDKEKNEGLTEREKHKQAQLNGKFNFTGELSAEDDARAKRLLDISDDIDETRHKLNQGDVKAELDKMEIASEDTGILDDSQAIEESAAQHLELQRNAEEALFILDQRIGAMKDDPAFKGQAKTSQLDWLKQHRAYAEQLRDIGEGGVAYRRKEAELGRILTAKFDTEEQREKLANQAVSELSTMKNRLEKGQSRAEKLRNNLENGEKTLKARNIKNLDILANANKTEATAAERTVKLKEDKAAADIKIQQGQVDFISTDDDLYPKTVDGAAKFMKDNGLVGEPVAFHAGAVAEAKAAELPDIATVGITMDNGQPGQASIVPDDTTVGGVKILMVPDAKTGKLEPAQKETRAPSTTFNIDNKPQTPTNANAIAAAITTVDGIGQILGAVFQEDGSVDRALLFEQFAGLPFSAGRSLETYVGDVMAMTIKAISGQTVTEDERKRLGKTFAPSIKDDPQTVRNKLQALMNKSQFALNIMDPEGTFQERGRGGPTLDPNIRKDQLKKTRNLQGNLLSDEEVVDRMLLENYTQEQFEQIK